MSTPSIPLEEQVVNRLISLGYHISCAESCTGGLLAASIVNVSNASKVLSASFVTYSEEAKATYAQVSPSTIATHGVVSEAVAREMALGVAAATGSDVGVGITGIAGPTGGTKELPVGTVCFGISIASVVTTRTMQFGAIGRNEVRHLSVTYALNLLLSLLNN